MRRVQRIFLQKKDCHILMCIFYNNPMVGTIKNFSQVGGFDFQQFQQISIKKFLFFQLDLLQFILCQTSMVGIVFKSYVL